MTTEDRFEAAIRQLGAPLYRDDFCAIYNGDSTKLLNDIPKDTFDLTVTSPPYNIGKSYEKIVGVGEYVKWTRLWIDQVFNVTSDTGSFWLNLGYMPLEGQAKALPIPYLIWDAVPFYLMQEIVWNYGAGVASRYSFSPRNEKFLWYVKAPNEYTFNLDDVRDPDVKYPNQKKNGKLKCNPLGKNPTDVWSIPKVTSGKGRSSSERTSHPAQFPLAVIQRIIRACSNKGDLLFDPFLGSGSLAEAALIEDRRVIGIELNAEYAKLAVDRIKHYRRQPSLI